ncbi:MAG: oligosaccharide flippase family protein [Myxococcales bacterium]|nr:oligosaccharide flippase family protein [Myxococcales bacterium]
MTERRGSRVREWFRDRAVRRVVKYGIPVAVGRVVVSIAGLITTAMLARHLGPELFGVLAVMRTLVTTVGEYANFNTWQAIIKYGTEAIAERRPEDVKRVIKLAFVLDVVTAAIAAIVIAVLAFAIATTFDWSSTDSKLCVLYTLTIVTRVAGAPDGIFRICDAYRPQAIATSVSAALMTISVGIAVALDASFAGCVVALVIAEVIGNLLPLFVAITVAATNGFGGWLFTPLRGARTAFPGIARFLVATNGQGTVKKTQSDVDMFVIGAMLGKIPSGLFRVVKQLGTIPGRVFMPFEQVLFTELARAAAAHDYATFRRLLLRLTIIVGVGSLLIWGVAAVAAEPVIRIVAGDEFIGAAPAFRWYLLAMVLNVMNTPVQRAIVALGRPGTLFWFDLGSTILLIGAAIAGARYGGLVGVSLALIGHKVVQAAWSTWLVARISYRRQRDHAAAVTPDEASSQAAPPPPAPR